MPTVNETKITVEETKVNNVENAESTPKKRRGRGLGTVRGASRLKFDERDIDRSTYLFKGHLDSIEISYSTEKEDSANTSFAGLAVPRLVLTFASNTKDVQNRKYATLRIAPAESNALTIPGAKEAWKVEQPLNWLKHILNVFVLKGNEMTEETEDMLTLPFEDFVDTPEGGFEYQPVEAEDVLNGWKVLFENFIAIMNNDGKPYYKSQTGDILPIWMKLIRYQKVPNKNKKMVWKSIGNGGQTGDFLFTPFVGEGAIELYNQSKTPTLRVDFQKESIVAQKVEEETPKAPNMPNIPGIPSGAAVMNPGVPAPSMPGYDAGNVNAPTQAGSDDLPF